MWMNEELMKKMFVQSVVNQTRELERARKLNAELLEKSDKLEKEKNILNGKLNDNQLGIANEKNQLNGLLEELKNQKKLNMDLTQRLDLSNMQLDMLQAEIDQTNNLNEHSLTDLKPMREILTFKWDVVDCLEKMLVATRLQTAEQDAIITELKKRETELNNDLQTLNDIKPSSVSKWQEEFLDARIKEADVILEFDKIKRVLTTLKQDVNEKLGETENELENSSEDFFSIKFNLRDKYQDQIKSQEDISISVTVELQNELDRLKMQIKELQRIKEDINKQIYFNEETKVHLHEVRSSIYQRLQNTNLELNRQVEKNRNLDENMNKEILQIQHNIDHKMNNIAERFRQIAELQLQNDKSSQSNEESMSSLNENTEKFLEEEIERLEEKIQDLKET